MLTIFLVVAASHVAASEGKTLVVDLGDTANFKTLRSAVAATTDGDEILMKPGSYRERDLLINRSISIRGEPGVRIDGLGGTIIQVMAPGCAISNLTLEGSENMPAFVLKAAGTLIDGCTIVDSYRGIDVRASNNTVEGCRISTTSYAVRLAGSWSRVSNSTISGGNGDGVTMDGCEGSIVSGNEITGCSAAVNALGANDSAVTGNSLRESNVGVRLAGSSGGVVAENNLTGNKVTGIYLENSRKNEIRDNVLGNNGDAVHLRSSGDNLIEGNVATMNQYAITLKGSRGNVLRNNTMQNNSYNLRVEPGESSDLTMMARPISSVEDAYFQDIDPSNTANGLPICYLLGAADETVAERCGFVALIGCKNVTVLDQEITNSSVGVLLVNSTGCKVRGCRLIKSETGVSILESDGCSVVESLAENCMTGFRVTRSDDDLLNGDASVNCTESGFRLDGSRRTILKDSEASGSVTGISLYDTNSANVIGCEASDNVDYGIRLGRSHKVALTGNHVHNNGKGIELSGSNGCVISRNNASQNDQAGISLEQLTGAKVHTNVARWNRVGAFLQSAKGVLLEDNELSQNSRYGLRMSSSFECNVTNNRFMHNSLVGAGLVDCEGNYLYNNDFVENGIPMANNAVDNGENQWDLGPVTGGNYWSEHKVVGNPSGEQRVIASKGLDRYPFQDPGGWLA